MNEPLTRIQTLILRGCSYGMSYGEIAWALGLEVAEVGRQVFQIYEKIHAIERSRYSSIGRP